MAIRDIYHDAGTIAHHRRDGLWADGTLDDYVPAHARERGAKLAIVDRRWRLPLLYVTASGKIQKYLLREEIARLVGHKALIR